MKILIVKLSSIGDIVHALPVLSAIKNGLPDAEISWAVEKRIAELLRGNPYLSQLFEIDTKALRQRKTFGATLFATREQLRKMRASNFDVAIDFQGLLKSATIVGLSGAKRRFGFAPEAMREPSSRFLLTDTFEVEPDTHIIVKNLTLASKTLKIPVPQKDFEFPIFTDESHRSEAEKVISQTGMDFAILNPAGSWTTKIWSAEKFGALADRLWEENGLVSVLTTAPADRALAAKVASASRTGKVVSVNLSLKGFFELAKRARVYVGGDTGPTHIAIAAGAPVVGIFGPTRWERNGSTNEKDICVERTDIGCRTDCVRRTCANWICMDMETQTVLRAAQKRLKTESEKRKIEFSYSSFPDKIRNEF